MIRFFRQLFSYISKYNWMAVVLLFSMIFEGGLESATRFSFRFLIDDIVATQSKPRLVILLLLMAAGAALLTALCFLADYLWAKLGALLLNEIRQKLLGYLQTLSMGFFSTRLSGDILSRFIADANSIEASFVTVIPYLVVNLTAAGFSLAFMFTIEPMLAIWAFIGMTFCILVPQLFSKVTTKASVGMRTVQGHVTSRLQEIIQSQTMIKSFGLETEFESRFEGVSNLLLKASTRANFLAYLSQRIPVLLFYILALFFLAVSADLTMKGKLTLGELISFQVLLLGLKDSITNMTWLAPVAVDGIASMERINEVFREIPQVTPPINPIFASPLSTAIRFEDIHFSYTSRGKDKVTPVLNGLSFTIEKNDFFLIVGPSGSGKTSLLLLMLRLYDPNKGHVFYDGQNLNRFDPQSIRGMFGFVGQEPMLFDGTIRDNIRLGRLDASDEEIWTALDQAEIKDMVSTFPSGLDTPIGERGGYLSAGQRQRLALARALVRRPSVLLLDEVTSALDNTAEFELLETLKRISLDQHITIIAVSHRLRFSLAAKKILVIGQGGVMEDQGSHTDLLGRDGSYAKLWRNGQLV